ncbi:MAG: DUF423 domain-containing protein [Campylobacterota bacterium]|nr:DUF423 domain-containing protein [Campylobacterota bacterium]
MNNSTKKFIRYGAFMMALSVALGAFGAHALKSILDENMIKVYNTAVEYQFYHALGLFVVAFVAFVNDTKRVNLAGNIMFVSTFIFSGSLYIMTITGIKWLGAITPIGGTGFIIAWVILALSVSKSNNNTQNI